MQKNKICILLAKSIRIILTSLLFLLILLNVWLLANHYLLKSQNTSLFGFSLEIVMSGSMSPTINAGDILLVQRQNEYKCDDVITFIDAGFHVTHRIVEKRNEDFITQGDNNNTRDRHPVKYEQIMGTVILIIPSLGTLALFLRTPIGILIIVGLSLLLSVHSGLKIKKSIQKKGCNE